MILTVSTEGAIIAILACVLVLCLFFAILWLLSRWRGASEQDACTCTNNRSTACEHNTPAKGGLFSSFQGRTKTVRVLPGTLSKVWPFSGSSTVTALTLSKVPTESSADRLFLRDEQTAGAPPVLHIFFGFGANYYGTANELLTCNNDVRAIYSVWSQHITKGAPSSACRSFLLSDTPGTASSLQPTRANWMRTVSDIQTLANTQHANGGRTEILYMSSSHGFFQRTTNPDELDGMAECFVATDGLVWDYEIAETFLRPLPSSVHLCAIFDSCNSGSVMNLPWMYNRLSDSCNQDSKNTSLQASVWAISGCRDEQTSAAGRTARDLSVLTFHMVQVLVSAFTNAPMNTSTTTNNTSTPMSMLVSDVYLALLLSLLRKHENQIPLLTTSHSRLTTVPLF